MAVYLAQWPTGEMTILEAKSKNDAIEWLDEITNVPKGMQIQRLHHFMIDCEPDPYWELDFNVTQIGESDIVEICDAIKKGREIHVEREKRIGIRHIRVTIERTDDYQTATEKLLDAIRSAAEDSPGQPRKLFIEIEAHDFVVQHQVGPRRWTSNEVMFDLQTKFIAGVLAPFVTEIFMPFGHIINPRPQRDDLPEKL